MLQTAVCLVTSVSYIYYFAFLIFPLPIADFICLSYFAFSSPLFPWQIFICLSYVPSGRAAEVWFCSGSCRVLVYGCRRLFICLSYFAFIFTGLLLWMGKIHGLLFAPVVCRGLVLHSVGTELFLFHIYFAPVVCRGFVLLTPASAEF